MELTLLWAVLTAVALGWIGLRIWPDHLPDRPLDRLIGAAVAGLAAARLTAMLSQGINPLTNPGDIVVIRGGVHTGAAAVAFIATLYWTTREERSSLDALAPAVLLALAGWHGGCQWRAACLGSPSDLPWAWALDASDTTRHPVEIYAAVGLALAAWLVSTLGWRAWVRAGVALAAAAAVRLLTEPLRPSITGGPVTWYLAGMAIGAALAVLGPRLWRWKAPAPT